jgi:exopolyphosphatase/guanosine-5'-triphosphate,3'-diphosphate pyrophosphatase
MPRVGAAVSATGSIGAPKLAEVAADVRRFATLAREQGADTLLLGATEAVRRAADRDLALRTFSDAAGVPCVLISPEAEARLAFRGAASEHGGEGLMLVADIGGGSTECILGERGRIDALASVAVGSGTATDRWLTHDPPTAVERAACAAGVDAALAAAPQGAPLSGAVTGGTATTLPRLLGRSELGLLDAADLQRCRDVLGASSSDAVAAATGIAPVRARVLAGGVEIVDAVRRRYRLDALVVSERGLRDGMILSWLEKGDAWMEG